MPSNTSATAVWGTFWSYLTFASGKTLTFVSTVVLARILTPEHFGLVAYALLAVQTLDVLASFGMGSAIISRRDKVTEAMNVAFILSVLMGVFLYLIAWLGTPYVASFFREEAITSLLRTIALVLPIGALGVVPSAVLEREFRFRVSLAPHIARNVLKGVVAIGLAYQGFGAWSIIYGHIVGDIVYVGTLLVIVRWRPTTAMDRKVTREMIWYGYHSLSVSLLGVARNQIDYVLVGRLIGTQALGLYTLAFRIPDLIIRNINSSVGRVTLPILSRAQESTGRLESIYFAYLRYTALVIFPAGLGLSIASPLLVGTLFTPEWEEAIPVMQMIAVAVAIGSIGYAPGVLYKSIGRPDILNKLAFVKGGVALGVLWYSAQWGILGVATGQVFVSSFGVLLDTTVIWRVLDFEVSSFFRAIAPASIATLVMGGVLWTLTVVIPLSGFVGLIVLIAVGVLTYGAAVFLVSRDVFLSVTQMFRLLIARRSTRTSAAN